MTVNKRLITDMPIEINRSSSSEWSGSEIVAILGSLKMVAPSSKLTPCFLRLLFDFSSSHSNSEFFMTFALPNYTLSVRVCINCRKWLFNWRVESHKSKVASQRLADVKGRQTWQTQNSNTMFSSPTATRMKSGWSIPCCQRLKRLA